MTTKKVIKKVTKKKVLHGVKLMTLAEVLKKWAVVGNKLIHPTKKDVSIDLENHTIDDFELGSTKQPRFLSKLQKELVARNVYKKKQFKFTADGYGEETDVTILDDGSIEANCGENLLSVRESKELYTELHKIFGPKPAKKVKK